jgi:hypothetical protein
MKNKRNLPFYVLLFVFCTFLLAGAGPDQEQTNVQTVKVMVRFAKIRVLPATDAKIIKQIGYGTMLLVLGKSGEYYLVTAIDASPASAKQAWYILKNEVETATTLPTQENRQIKFEPLHPVAGQPILFTALNFRTPNLLKWDMGDGTVLTSGSKSSPVREALLSYAYTAAGTYEVKVYDDNGNMNLPPVSVLVPATAYPRSLQVNPEKPLANHPLEITALNFSTPENIYWDMGDGTSIKPGDKNGIVKPCFLVTHIYALPGAYTIKAYDFNSDKNQQPLSRAIQVEADPLQIKAEPKKTTFILDNSASAKSIPNEVAAKVEPNKPVESRPAPQPVKKYPLIKVGPYAGYFQPKDAWLKTIYGKGDMIYGGRLGVHAWQGFYAWISYSQYRVIGETTFSKDKTTLTLAPLSIFLRYNISLGALKPYAGIGYTYMSFKEESDISDNTTGNGKNIAYEAGFELQMSRNFFVDLNVRYDQIKVTPKGSETDLGGLQAGISLLVSF